MACWSCSTSLAPTTARAERPVGGAYVPQNLLATLYKEVFGIEAAGGDGVVFQVEHGEEFIPRLFASLGVGIRSVSVARPTLDDVFMEHTGRTIRDAESSGSGIRNNPFVRAQAGRR